MRVKELKRTVNVSWSPGEHYPIYLAAGSAAQQVDASFSSNSQLEIYGLNLEEPGLDLELKASLPTKNKFHKLVWSGAGVIVGGCDSGRLEFYSSDRLLKGGDALLTHSDKHNGNVSALDVNPYQKNLVASGAADSEIFIWDLGNTSQPMAPGSRSQPPDHVQGLAWNQQVQHILGSTFATRCVVWDLRKNEPIMKLSDSQSRTAWRALAWHPSVATQLCIASELDQRPVIQLWDLRLAASPLATLEGHSGGVLALSWSSMDPGLLLSAGKDGRVLCWDPHSTQGEALLCELSAQPQWVFDAGWSPRDPALFVTAAADSLTAVHSLLGGGRADSSAQSNSSILESFGGLASMAALPAVARVAAGPPSGPQLLPRPPRWLMRPRGGRFGFGGKLVTFDKCPEGESQRLVHVSQVVSEPELVQRAAELDAVLGSGMTNDPGVGERLAEYCMKAAEQSPPASRAPWLVLRAAFLPDCRDQLRALLGYKMDDIPGRFKPAAGSGAAKGLGDQPESAMLSRCESTETDAELSTDTSSLSDAHTLLERRLANLEIEPTASNVAIPHGEDPSSLICRALVCGQLEEAVELCLSAQRTADALIIASLGSQELLYKVQKYHLSQSASDPVCLLAGSLLASRWDALVQGARASDWKDVLAALVTHTDGEALAHYCEMLGDKLSSQPEPGLSEAATLCYLCAMSGQAVVPRASTKGAMTADSLTRRAELALLVRQAALARGRQVQSEAKLQSVLCIYALRLSSQGCLQAALGALGALGAAGELGERIRTALGMAGDRRQSQPAPVPSSNRTRTSSSNSKRGHVVAHNDVSHTYSNVPSSFEQSPWGATSVAAPGGPAVGPVVPPGPPVAPRPGSVGPTGGNLTRNKYKVDPSVQSSPQYNQYNYNQTQSYYNNPMPDQYNSVTAPLNPTFNPVNPAPLNPVNAVPLNPVNPAAVNGSYYSSEPAMAAQPTKPVAPGWNDPPMQTSKPKHKQEVLAQAPITHPLFGVEPPQHVPLNPAQTYPGQQLQYPGQAQQYPTQPQQYPGQAQQYPGQQQQYPGQQQQYPGQQYPGYQDYSGQQQMPQQGYPQKPSSPVPAPAPVVAPVAPKPPLPAPLQPLQQCFDNLLIACQERATHPQMKRKLEDVHKRLETLYDLLREGRLSQAAVSSLQQCATECLGSRWGPAGEGAASLAQGHDFAAAASFLPGLKVLIQLSQQLQVTVG